MDTSQLETPEHLDVGEGVRLYRPSQPEEAVSSERPTYILYFDVVDELVFAARYRDRSSLAVLDGTRRLDRGGEIVKLTGFFGYQYVSGAERWQKTVRGALERRTDAPEEDGETPSTTAAGYFASISGTEGSMTPELVRLHMSLFNRPHQVVLAFDPDAGQLGMHVRREGERFVNVPFAVAYRAEDREESAPTRSAPDQALENHRDEV